MASPNEIETEVIAREDGRLALRTRVIGIDIVAGPNAGQYAQLTGPMATIGSGKSCDLILLDRRVSRHHATLRIERGQLRVIDEGSSNGTQLDGVRIRDAFAEPNSTLHVGTSTLRLRVERDAVHVPLSSREHFGGLIGTSSAMRQLYTLLELVCDTDDTVLVRGETGTGKELVAEALHEESRRADGPFVVFDCSAVSRNLLESELFGHVRGAFTGAVGDRAGALESAHEGTLFIDEIGELPLELQPKLLRALERFEVKPVGANTSRRVDVRVVAATHRDLLNEVSQGRFREDLFYRLAVVHLQLPPLRERRDDIPVLARHFENQLRNRPRRSAPKGELDERTLRELSKRSWPGNVRELRNAVARVLSLGPAASPNIATPSIPEAPAVDLEVPLKVAKAEIVDTFERAYCLAALHATGGNATQAAALAGVNRKYMQRAIKRLRLREDLGELEP